MSQLEPYLSDQEVSSVATKIIDENEKLQRYNSAFVTTRVEPPWHGQLPDGRVGWTAYPVVQFVILSDHPRPLQRSFGLKHGTYGSAWEGAYESAAKDFKRSVTGDTMSPLERIFRGVAAKHIEELDSLASIMN